MPPGVTTAIWGQNNLNKALYDWFPRKSQNSKKLEKGRETYNYFWKIEAKNSQKGQIWPKMAKF